MTTIASTLSNLDAHDAMIRANELCPESKRGQDWVFGSTTWTFADWSRLRIEGPCVFELREGPSLDPGTGSGWYAHRRPGRPGRRTSGSSGRRHYRRLARFQPLGTKPALSW